VVISYGHHHLIPLDIGIKETYLKRNKRRSVQMTKILKKLAEFVLYSAIGLAAMAVGWGVCMIGWLLGVL
jgi:hypothetical protein